MLVDVRFDMDETVVAVLLAIGNNISPQKVSKGIYINAGHNMSNFLDETWQRDYSREAINEKIKLLMSGEEVLPEYGVCDSVEQFIELFHEKLESDKQNEYVVGLTCVRKDEQSPEGGWRWHKWGEYFGKHKSKCEYLYDEVGIDEVWCFSIEKRAVKC